MDEKSIDFNAQLDTYDSLLLDYDVEAQAAEIDKDDRKRLLDRLVTDECNYNY